MDDGGVISVLVFIAGFLVAQVSKLVGAFLRNRGELGFSDVKYWLFRSGGMPSGHAASMVGVTTALGWMYGVTSTMFAIMACLSVIIVYDAVNVRYAVGEQGKAMNRELKQKVRVVEGHTIMEALVGAIMGFAIGTIGYLAYGMWLTNVI